MCSGSEEYRSSLSKLVRHNGHRSSVAGSQAEASRALDQLKSLSGPRAVIVSCDPYLEMPAHEFIKWLRKQNLCKNVPVILLADPEEAGHQAPISLLSDTDLTPI